MKFKGDAAFKTKKTSYSQSTSKKLTLVHLARSPPLPLSPQAHSSSVARPLILSTRRESSSSKARFERDPS